MDKQEKIVFVVTNGEERRDMLEIPLNLAMLAAAIDVEVIMTYTGAAGLLLKQGVAEKLTAKEGGTPLIQTIRSAKEAGVKIYVCSPVLDLYNLKKEDFIEEITGIAGGMFLITESLEANVTYTY